MRIEPVELHVDDQILAGEVARQRAARHGFDGCWPNAAVPRPMTAAQDDGGPGQETTRTTTRVLMAKPPRAVPVSIATLSRSYEPPVGDQRGQRPDGRHSAATTVVRPRFGR